MTTEELDRACALMVTVRSMCEDISFGKKPTYDSVEKQLLEVYHYLDSIYEKRVGNAVFKQ